MHVIGHILFGLVIGIIAKFLYPGRDPGGIIVTILLGMAGAWLGGYLGQMLGLYKRGQAAGFLMALVGALLLLFLYHMFVGRTARTAGSPAGAGTHLALAHPSART